MYITPSLTSFNNGWPRYRIYKVNKRTLEVLDFTNYYIDLNEANMDTTKYNKYLDYIGKKIIVLNHHIMLHHYIHKLFMIYQMSF